MNIDKEETYIRDAEHCALCDKMLCSENVYYWMFSNGGFFVCTDCNKNKSLIRNFYAEYVCKKLNEKDQRIAELEEQLKNAKKEMKILNVQWFNNVGIVTIDNGFEIKTYIKEVKGLNEEQDIQDIINLGFKIYPEQLEKILSFYKEEDKGE